MFQYHLYFIHFFIIVSYKKDLPFGRYVICLWSMLLVNIAMFCISVVGLVSKEYNELFKEINFIRKTFWLCFLFSSFHYCILLFCNILYSKYHTVVCVWKIQGDIYLVILAGISDIFAVYHLFFYWPSVWISSLLLQIQMCELLDSKVHRHRILLELNLIKKAL